MDLNDQDSKLMTLVDVQFVLGLKNSFKKVTLERYNTLLKTTRSTIKHFLENGATKTKEKKRDPLDYQKMKDAFSKKLDPDRIAAVVDNYGEPIDTAAVFLSEDITNLFNEMPTNHTATIFGIEETDPSNYEMSKWLNKISIFFYPVDVLRHFKNGNLSRGEVENLKLIYPDFYGDIQRIAFEEIVAKKEGNLSLKDNQTLSILLGIQRLSPYLIKSIQQMLTASEKADNAAKQSGSNGLTADGLKTEVEASLSA